LGTTDIGGRTFYWQDFTKGVNKPSQAQAGSLGLGVLATQSGGLALNSSNDVAAQLQKCLADTGVYYELSFDPPPAHQRDEFHHLEVKVAKSGLTARTRQGYYSQPLPHPSDPGNGQELARQRASLGKRSRHDGPSNQRFPGFFAIGTAQFASRAILLAGRLQDGK
jgi:hypothetical protein